MRRHAARNTALALLAVVALAACQQDDRAVIPDGDGTRTEDPGLSGPSPSIDNEAMDQDG